jgi:hypothetical protein
MSILDLLKEKAANEKQNFLNSIRIKASTKLKNTDDNKIIDIISITSDITLDNLIPIKKSRLFKTFFVAYFHPIFLNKNNYTFCNVFDNKEEFDEAIRIIKKYYKTNFRV